jgi:hypothetical protein
MSMVQEIAGVGEVMGRVLPVHVRELQGRNDGVPRLRCRDTPMFPPPKGSVVSVRPEAERVEKEVG